MTSAAAQGPSVFDSPENRKERLTEAAAARLERDKPWRVLDLGCGTGRQLLHLAGVFPAAQCLGVDIMQENIAAARELATAEGADRLRFEAGDYVTMELGGPFDLIISDSVLHLIEHPDEALYPKLARDLAPDGLLIATIPYQTAYNRLLWGVRALLRRLPRRVVDGIARRIGRVLHGSLDQELLVQRIPYLYMLPTRKDEPRMRDALRRHGVELIDTVAVPHASIAQAKHRLVVYRRAR